MGRSSTGPPWSVGRQTTHTQVSQC